MRTIFDRLGWGVAGAAIVTLVVILAGAVRAGPLDPPGAPAPTAGVLRPGTPISTLPYTITQPGSYYVTGNLTGASGQNGILINANSVTLDLNGFTLQGVPGSGTGVKVDQSGFKRAITIRNGIVRGWGDTGISAQFAIGGVLDSLTAEGNGLFGIVVGADSTLTHCTAVYNGATGIEVQRSTIRDCTATGNGGNGFRIGASVLIDCISDDNGFDGITASFSSSIQGCVVEQNGGRGIHAQSSAVRDNRVAQNDGNGIEIEQNGSLVVGNSVHINSFIGAGSGILVSGSSSRIDGNHVTDEGGTPTQEVGINVTGSGNVVVRNTARGNVDNYSLTGAGGDYGPETLAATTTSPWANIAY